MARTKINRLRRKKDRQLLLIALPAIIKLFLFSYVPLIWLVVAFEFYKPTHGILGSELVSFDNFLYLFKSSQFIRIVWNSVSMSLMFIFTKLAVSLMLGLFFYEISNKLFIKASQTMIMFPFFVSWPLVGTLLLTLVGPTGMLSKIYFNMTGNELMFYQHPEYWKVTLTLINIWKTCGVSAVVFYAVLMNQDKSVYEAAHMDGAGRFKTMWHISLPALKMMSIIQIIMQSANVLRFDFGMAYYVGQLESNSQLYPAIDVIETYMFRAMRKNSDFSVSAATGLIQSVFGLLLSFLANWVCTKLGRVSLY